MMRKRAAPRRPARVLLVLFFAASLPFVPSGPLSGRSLAAQDRPPPPDSVVSLGELIVSALRSPATAGEVPVNVTTISREDLRLSAARTLQDVLQEVPGLNFRFPFQSAVAHPSWQAVSLRGLGGTAASRTLVLVDGVPLNDPYFGWVRWSQVPAEAIERIEIVRGGATVAWGSRSLAGVVHVITRQPGGKALSAGAEGGSLSTFRGDAMASVGNDRTGGYLAGEFFDSNGYTLTEPSLRGAVDIPSASNHAALRGKVSVAAGDNLTFYGHGSYFSQDKDNATPLRNNNSKAGSGQIGFALATGGGSRLNATLYHHSQSYANSFSSVDAMRASEQPSISQDVPSRGTGASLVWDNVGAGILSITLGGDMLRARGDATERYLYRNDAFSRQRETGGTQLLYGFFAQNRMAVGDRLHFYGGLRLDVWRNTAGFRRVFEIEDESVLADSEFDNRAGTKLSHNVGLLFSASDAVAIRGSFYSGLRVPTLNELYKPFRAAGNVANESNEQLKPEQLLGAEVGFDIQPSPAVLVRLTGFWARVSNAITDVTIQEAATSGVIQPCGFVAAGGVCRRRDNVGTLRSIGLETAVEVRPGGAWLFAASHQFNPTEVTGAPGRPDLIGNDVQGSPAHRAIFRIARADPSTLDVSATGRYLGSRFDNDINTGKIAASFLVDVRLRRQLTARLSAFASAQNIFGTIAEMSHDANGFVRVAAPRTLTGGIRLRLGRAGGTNRQPASRTRPS